MIGKIYILGGIVALFLAFYLFRTGKIKKITLKVFGQEITLEKAFKEIEDRIHVLQMLIKASVTEFQYEKLKGLADNGPFLVSFHWDMYHELRRLDALRYVQPNEGYGIESIRERDGSGDKFDLKKYVYITKQGIEYLKLREELLRINESKQIG